MSAQIITKRFLLRDFTESDGPAFLGYHADPRYAKFYAPEEVGPDHAKDFSNDSVGGQPSGCVEIISLPSPVFGTRGNYSVVADCVVKASVPVGYRASPLYWGRYGYAIEIANALLKFGFRDLELTEVRGFSNSPNMRVTRLARRYGGVIVGTDHASDWMRARGWSQIEWRLTRERWEKISAV